MLVQFCIGRSAKYQFDAKVLEHSIRVRSSVGVDVRFVPEHEAVLSRPWEPNQTTTFSFTRFLSPYIWGYKGFTIYMDPDMLCLCDAKEIAELIDPQYVVQVVEHDYTPAHTTKFVGQQTFPQTTYARKNWSSFIIFNNEKCQTIYTHETINTLPGFMLHSFANLEDNLIGSLPKEYNYLVGEENQAEKPKIIHFTNGMPYATSCEYETEWREEVNSMLSYLG